MRMKMKIKTELKIEREVLGDSNEVAGGLLEKCL